MLSSMPPECLASRVARFARHRERGEWASCHVILNGLRQCAEREGCAERLSCTEAAGTLRVQLQGLLETPSASRFGAV